MIPYLKKSTNEETVMKRTIWIRAIALILAMLLTGCAANTLTNESTVSPATNAPVNTTESSTEAATTSVTDPTHEHNYVASEVVAATCESEGYTVYTCDCGDTYNDDYTEEAEHTYEETVIPPTAESEGYTLYMCTVCNYAYKDNYTDKVVDDGLTPEQRNSIAMLNYLATLTQEINASRNSRMFLEEAYASLINNINPEKVDELTKSHLCSLLDTIERYRVIAVKRERLAYLYNQNKARAIKQVIPNSKAFLNATTSLDVKRLAAAVAYMAVDSIASYTICNDDQDEAFLQDGWALDDEAADNLHESRKQAFRFMLEMVHAENLPSEFALNEIAVENFVTWTNNENIHQRLQFLESEEKTYRALGSYWLALAECYYDPQIEDYEGCLNAITMYEEYQAEIFRKDYYLAHIVPIAIAAASEVYEGQVYIDCAEKYLKILEDNTESNEWALRYFAAQIYMDLYIKTNDIQYMDKAYELTLNNVNFLAAEQKKLSATYLADVREVTIPNDTTKEEKNQIKEYYKTLKNNRKTELPSVYEPLLLNCELLFALLEKVDISASERAKIDSILGISGSDVFLTKPLINRYDTNAKTTNVTATFEKNTLTIPVYCVSNNSVVRVSVTENGTTMVYEDWSIKEVKRSEAGFESYVVTFDSEKVKKQDWSANSTVLVEIFDEADAQYDPVVICFRVSRYRKLVWETVEFEQVI